MAFSTTNIDKVRAMAFPAGMLSDGELVSLGGLVLVSWRSSETDKLFQVYVNGRWAGTTSHPQQRMLLVEYEHIHTAAIEVIAVEPAEKDTDYSDELSGFVGDGCHAILSWPKRGVLPLESKANVYWDGGNGEVDYGEPLTTQDIWCGQADKWDGGWMRMAREISVIAVLEPLVGDVAVLDGGNLGLMRSCRNIKVNHWRPVHISSLCVFPMGWATSMKGRWIL